MPLELQVRARLKGLRPEKKRSLFLDEIRGRVAERYADELAYAPYVAEPSEKKGDTLLQLPFATRGEALGVRATRDSEVHARTQWNVVGPGYLERCCEALRFIEQSMGFSWETVETGCERDGWPTIGEAQRAADAWLGGLMRAVLDQSPGGLPGRPLLMAMPLMVSPEGVPEMDADVLTPMGPRTLDWYRGGARDAALARDLFAWWDSGMTADTLLRLALRTMWEDVLWTGAPSEDDFRTQLNAVRMLERAYAIDPDLAYPWAEWHELIGHIRGVEEATGGQIACPEFSYERFVAERAAADGAPSIGYRRGRRLITLLGGWRLPLPGEFTYDPEESNEETASYFGPWCQVYMSSMQIQTDGTASREQLAAGAPGAEDTPYGWDEDGVLGVVKLDRDEDEHGPLCAVRAAVVALPDDVAEVAMMTLLSRDESRIEDMAALARGVRPPGREGASGG